MLTIIVTYILAFGELIFEQETRCEESDKVSEDSNKDLLVQTEVGKKQERRQPSDDEENRQSKKQNTSEDEAC